MSQAAVAEIRKALTRWKRDWDADITCDDTWELGPGAISYCFSWPKVCFQTLDSSRVEEVNGQNNQLRRATRLLYYSLVFSYLRDSLMSSAAAAQDAQSAKKRSNGTRTSLTTHCRSLKSMFPQKRHLATELLSALCFRRRTTQLHKKCKSKRARIRECINPVLCHETCVLLSIVFPFLVHWIKDEAM